MSHENVLVTAWGVPKWINCHVLIIYYGSCFWVCFYFWLFFSESTGCVKFLLFFPHCLVEDAANTEEIHEKTWKVMRHDQTWLKKDEKHHIYINLAKAIQMISNPKKSISLRLSTKTRPRRPSKRSPFFVHDMNLHYRGVLKLGSSWGSRIWVKCYCKYIDLTWPRPPKWWWKGREFPLFFRKNIPVPWGIWVCVLAWFSLEAAWSL